MILFIKVVKNPYLYKSVVERYSLPTKIIFALEAWGVKEEKKFVDFDDEVEEEPDIWRGGGFVTEGADEGEKQYVPKCMIDGTCGQGGPVAVAPAETGSGDTTPSDQAADAYKAGKALLLRNKRSQGAVELQSACSLEPTNRAYCVAWVEAHLYSSNSKDEPGSPSECQKAKAVLDGLRTDADHGDYEFLRGQYWDLCAGDFDQAAPHYGVAAANSEKQEWRRYASEWLEAMK